MLIHVVFGCWTPQTVFQEEQLKEWQKKLKLRNMDLRRWSSVVSIYDSTLWQLTTILRTYYKRMKPCPLRGKKMSLLHQYSIIKPVHDIIKHAQGGGMNGPIFLLNMVNALHGGVLDVTAPLEEYDPKTGKPKVVNGNTKTVQPDDLDPVASRTRELLRQGVETRFINGRYKGNKTASYLWDAALMAHPAYAGRKWVDVLAETPGNRLILNARISAYMDVVMR